MEQRQYNNIGNQNNHSSRESERQSNNPSLLSEQQSNMTSDIIEEESQSPLHQNYQDLAHDDEEEDDEEEEEDDSSNSESNALLMGLRQGIPLSIFPRELLPFLFGIMPQSSQFQSRRRTYGELEKDDKNENDLTYLKSWYQMINKQNLLVNNEIDHNDAVIKIISNDVYENNIPSILRETDEGISNRKIKNMPSIRYDPERGTKFHGEDAKCGICLAEYEKDDHVKILICLHKFHEKCVENWLSAHPTCPLCKWNLNKTTFHHNYIEVPIK